MVSKPNKFRIAMIFSGFLIMATIQFAFAEEKESTETLKLEEQICNTLVANKTISSLKKYFGFTNACLHQERINGKWIDTWIGNDDIVYKETFGGGFERAEPISKLDKPCDDNIDFVMQRNNCHFINYLEYERMRAVQVFNATSLTDAPKPTFAYEIPEDMKDCDGKITSYKTESCQIKKQMKLEQQKVIKFFNATKLLKVPDPTFTYDYPEEDQRIKLMKKHGLLWMRGQYN